MLDGLQAWLSARGQAPLAGYLRAFLEEYAPRATPGAAAATLACLGLALWLLPRWADCNEDASPTDPTDPTDPTAPAPPAEPPPPWPRLRLAAILLGPLLALAFQHLILEPLPHIADEATYLFEARLITGGAAAAPAPDPAVAALTGVRFTTIHDGRWFGAFPPGWPLLLAPLVALGLHWLAGPLLLAANLALLSRWATRHFGEPAGTGATWLAALSPCWIPLHASLMADPLTLACLLAFVLALEDDHPALAGLAAGWAILTRPAALFFVAGALLAETLSRRRTPRAPTLGQAARFLAGGAPALLVFLAWNHATTGSALTPPYSLAAPAAFQGAARYEGLTIRHDLASAAVNLGMNAAALATDLLGWPALSWLPVLAGCALAGAQRRGGCLRFGALGLALGYAGYFHPGFAYGPRFYLAATPWLLAAAALGLGALARARGVAPASGAPRLWVAALPAALLGYGLPTLEGYIRYTGVDARPLAHVDAHLPDERPLLVWIPARGYPERPLMMCFHGRVDPYLQSPVVYLERPADPAEARRLTTLLGRTPWSPPQAGAPWQLGEMPTAAPPPPR